MKTKSKNTKSPKSHIKNIKLIIIIIILLLFILLIYKIGSNRQIPQVNNNKGNGPYATYYPLDRRIIDVQGYTFNEPGLNIADEDNPIAQGTWKINNLKVTADGIVKGSIEVTFPVPGKFKNKLFKDILFSGVISQIPFGSSGDFGYVELGKILPVMSAKSTPQNAYFEINRPIDLSKKYNKNSIAEITLTWVRMYRENGTLFFYVMPVLERGKYIDEDGNSQGHFGYYLPINENSLKDRLAPTQYPGDGKYNYYLWIKNNISNIGL